MPHYESAGREGTMKAYSAEFLGTFWLVLGGCGSAVLAGAFPALGIGFHGVALAFGLTVLTMAYEIGQISGCHLNPAVSIGAWAGGRFPAGKVLPYIVSQVLGALAAGGILYLIVSGKEGFRGSRARRQKARYELGRPGRPIGRQGWAYRRGAG
jgi:aquaporin Z